MTREAAPASAVEHDVAIVGGGPAGMLLGLLLAKQGIRTLVLERHKDFDREYRGEVLMPRFTQVVQALGLFDRIQEGVHRKLEAAQVFWRDRRIASFQIARVCPEVPFALWQPQPVLLQILHDLAKEHDAFDLWFQADVKDLCWDGEGSDRRCTGLRVRHDGTDRTVRAKLTVGADGRFSTVRRHGGFDLAYEEHKFDVLWFSIPEPPDTPPAVRFYLSGPGAWLALPKHPALLQCGMLLPGNAYANYHRRGIGSLRKDLLAGPALLHDFARGLEDFEPFVLLQAKLDLVREWAKPGLLLIGDAAHTCSPVGAIGVAVAIHTAAVAAEVIPACLARDDVSGAALGEVQRIREPVVRRVHRNQRRFSGFVASRSSWGRRVAAVAVTLGSFLGITRPLARLATLEAPYRPGPALVTEERR